MQLIMNYYRVLNQIKFYFELCSTIPLHDVVDKMVSRSCWSHSENIDVLVEPYTDIVNYLMDDAYLDFETFFTQVIIETKISTQYGNDQITDMQRKKYTSYICRNAFHDFVDHIAYKIINTNIRLSTFKDIFVCMLQREWSLHIMVISTLTEYVNDIFPEKEDDHAH